MAIQDPLQQAILYHQQGQLEQAVAEYQRCIKQQPTSTAYTNLGVALRSQGHIEAALVAYRKALALDPQDVSTLSNLGGGLRALGQLDEAILVLQQALALDSNFAAAHYNLGLAYMDFQQPEKAIPCFETALQLEPDRVDAPFDRAVCLLQTGNFKAGFPAYESRFAYEPRLQRPYSQPQWQGESLAGKTLLIYAEQGFGDTLQFIRFVTRIEKAGGQLILECPAPLQRLMRSLPALDQVITPEEAAPDFDYHIALLSLSALFQTTLATIPSEFPYLRAPVAREPFPNTDTKRVGVVWASGHPDVGARNRSIPLTAFAPLLSLPGYQFYSFQKGPAVTALTESGLGPLVQNLEGQIQDFSDTAALLSQMDLLISADTAIVHLAGAMNVPCWVLLPSGSEWRWLLNRSDSPWYPSVRLFRQGYQESWASVMETVVDTLQANDEPQERAELFIVTPVNPAILYHPEGFTTQGSKLMGRQAAGESFLHAWCAHNGFDTVRGYGLTAAQGQAFHRQVQAYVAKESQWILPQQTEHLQEAGCLFLPGPGLAEQVWQRRLVSNKAYSVCGITHTTASDRVMASIGELLTAPTQAWDALICTSYSVKAMVQQVLNEYQSYLSERFHSKMVTCPVQLPVIPLGLETKTLASDETKRVAGQQLRRTLNIAEEATVFLFLGRLSFHAKAHPYPMMVALEAAAKLTQKPVTLILAGWFANEAIQQEFTQAAQQWCPSVQVIAVDGRKPEIRASIWYAADVFTSLSDNIQETFGLTPLEAKAAGLPVVVSDWDGYRETVREGLDGYLIPTWMSPAGTGKTLAAQYLSQQDSYDLYIGKTSQSIAVDIDACTQAYIRLINDPALRQQLGKQGQQDAQTRFDWSVVLTQYQSLWQELAAIRAQAKPSRPQEAPLNQDPYRLFASYPSRHIQPETRVESVHRSQLALIKGFSMTQVAKSELASGTQLDQLVSLLEQAPADLGSLEQASGLPQAQFYRTMGWLAKFGVVTLAAGVPK